MSRKKLNKTYGRSDVRQKDGRTDGHIDVQGNPLILRYNKNYDICSWMEKLYSFSLYTDHTKERASESKFH